MQDEKAQSRLLKHRLARATYPELTAPLLGECVALLAMEYGRAPLPVSRALWKGLLRQGRVNNTADLSDLARRYLLLGDERMLLAESSRQPTITLHPLALIKENFGSKYPNTEDPRQCP